MSNAVAEVAVEGRFRVPEWHAACAAHRDEHRKKYSGTIERPIWTPQVLQVDILDHIRTRPQGVTLGQLCSWRPTAKLEDLARACEQLAEKRMLTRAGKGGSRWVVLEGVGKDLPTERKASTEDFVVDDLARHPWSTAGEVADRTGILWHTVGSRLSSMVAAERLVRSGARGSYRYALPGEKRLPPEPVSEKPKERAAPPPGVKLKADLVELARKADGVTLADVLSWRPGLPAGDARRALLELVKDELLVKDDRTYRFPTPTRTPTRTPTPVISKPAELPASTGPEPIAKPVPQGKTMNRTARVLDHLRANPGSRSGEIAAALGDNSSAVASKLCDLMGQHRIRREGRPRHYRYFISEGKGSHPASPPAQAAPPPPAPAPSSLPGANSPESPRPAAPPDGHVSTASVEPVTPKAESCPASKDSGGDSSTSRTLTSPAGEEGGAGRSRPASSSPAAPHPAEWGIADPAPAAGSKPEVAVEPISGPTEGHPRIAWSDDDTTVWLHAGSMQWRLAHVRKMETWEAVLYEWGPEKRLPARVAVRGPGEGREVIEALLRLRGVEVSP